MTANATKRIVKMLLVILVLILIFNVNTSVCYANSAAPPSILIIVHNAPNDLVITLGSNQAHRKNTLVESYFTLYVSGLKPSDYTLSVTSNGQTFEITTHLNQYNNVFTLDLANRTLTSGESFSLPRTTALLVVQIVLTLVIEGIVFFLFGYRKKKSWLIFLILNLLTQGVLYVWLAQNNASAVQHFTHSSYFILSLVIGELFVFIAEIIGFLVFVNEHPRPRTVAYVIAANLLSLIAGGYIITYIPVYALRFSN